MKIKKLIIPIIVLLITIPAIITAYYAYRRYSYYLPVRYEHNKCNITTSALDNPYCGFYQIYPYKITGINPGGNILPGNINEIKDRLAMVQVNLSMYKDMPLSSDALSQLDSILGAWAGSNKQLILRFLYDWDGNASATEPSDIKIILKHMEQTASVYNKYADSIYILQGLYIGSYGEMHGSAHQDKNNIIRLARKLYNVSAPSIFLAVRTPAQLRAITEGTDGLVTGRLGLFNDGILSSTSDCGTYTEGKRGQELEFQDNLCLSVPNGGEAIIENPLNDINNAVKDLRKMHVSYLNSMYDASVLDKWKSSAYNGDGIFNECNGYEYIEKHLGYRYIINSSSLEFEPYSDETATLNISLENMGFAPCYYPPDYTITCINQETNKTYTIKPGINAPDNGIKEIKLSAVINVRDMEQGIYNIYLDTADSKTGETIKYAIDTTLGQYGYLAGTLSFLDK